MSYIWLFVNYSILLKCLKTQAKYISQCMDECRRELRTDSMDGKANAISKLCYVCRDVYGDSVAVFLIAMHRV